MIDIAKPPKHLIKKSKQITGGVDVIPRRTHVSAICNLEVIVGDWEEDFS